MITDRYYVKIVPERGETVHRFQVRRRHMAAAFGALALVILGSIGFAFAEVVRARMEVSHLAAQAAAQQASLRQIDRQTETLRKQLQHVQKQNTEIRQLIGAPPANPSVRQRTSWVRGQTLPAVAERVRTLSAESLASIDPVNGADVIGCYCYRTYPDVEFHPGVDLAADYGDVVRAAAAGTIVANWYDGGYGIKIDIDHGNGYHTWYAHLSRVMVPVGTHVYKGQSIGLVGATGFATGPHLHYQVMYEGSPVDPTPFLHGVPANVLAALP
jgi:murein DD-endopeptidase MepM/ murein hydrolase activator NlpD